MHPLNRGISYIGHGQVDLLAEPDHIVEIRYRIDNRGAPLFTLQTLLNWDGQSGGADSDGRISYDTIIDGQFHTVRLTVGASARKMIDHWYDGGAGGWVGKVDTFRFIFAHFQNIVSTSHVDGGYYWGNRGTSMAAPAVTGTVALMLQQFVRTHGVNLNYENDQAGNPPPLPSTIKAILIQTTTDLIHETPRPKDGDNPDTGSPVLYHEDPDFATGYGLINAESATHFISDAANNRLLYESELDIEQREIYKINVAFPLPELKVTLVWDDMESSALLGDDRLARLVNDLDLVLIDPGGDWHYPWRLDPLPFADCGGGKPGCGELDPIRPSDVRPAYKGPDARNNVEQVKIDNPSMGEWQVVIEGFGIQNVSDGPQRYSLVSSQSLSKITEYAYILSPNLTHSLDLGVNKKDGTFSNPFLVGDDLGVNYGESAIADFNGDGNPDHIVSTDENPARLYLHSMGCCGTLLGSLDEDPKADYYLSRNSPLLAPDYGLGLIAADLDNDGEMDFLENINYDFGSGKFWIAKGNAYLNDGSGNFTKISNAFDFHMISTGWILGMSSTIVDINGDGYPDMLASEQRSGLAVSSKVYLLKGLGNGRFEVVDANGDGVFDKTDDYVFQTDHHPATHITLGDFNNDGKVDALVGQDDDGDPGAAFLFLGHGKGLFAQTGIEAFDVCKDIESGTDQPCAGKFQA
ncbi:MAG: S8 family serine peptidase [Desulfobacterium sp.]|nr:S8 family serine peptidase [Desulfobacterium sp.]